MRKDDIVFMECVLTDSFLVFRGSLFILWHVPGVYLRLSFDASKLTTLGRRYLAANYRIFLCLLTRAQAFSPAIA
jgi:hypothetical protein